MKPSEQLRELVEWYSKTDCNDVQRTSMLLRGVELLIPAVEQLERVEWKGRLEELELCAESTIPILEWYGRRKPFLLQKLGGAE